MTTTTTQPDTATMQQFVGICERVGEPAPVDADIVIPVYNEQEQLTDSVLRLMDYLASPRADMPAFTWNIVIADNASTDATWPIAAELARCCPQYVRALRIGAKGRGRALKLAWGESRARARAYMDVDLSTDIRSTDVLLGAILSGQAEVATGCRLLDESEVTRSVKREFISRSYNVMLRAVLGDTFLDAQCGFKAISAGAATWLLPQVHDDEWFFDTELLTLAEAYGAPTYILPVRWVEDAGTTVNIPDTVRKDIRGMLRMRHALAAIEAESESAGARSDPTQEQRAAPADPSPQRAQTDNVKRGALHRISPKPLKLRGIRYSV